MVSLVKEGDQWKLDHLDEFIEFDQGALSGERGERFGLLGYCYGQS